MSGKKDTVSWLGLYVCTKTVRGCIESLHIWNITYASEKKVNVNVIPCLEISLFAESLGIKQYLEKAAVREGVLSYIKLQICFPR